MNTNNFQNDKMHLLADLELFECLQESEIALLANKLVKKDLKEGEFLIHEGDEASTAYIVIRGMLRIFKTTSEGKEIALGLRGRGALIGDMALLENYPRSATVQALTSCGVLVIYRDDFKDLVTSTPEFAWGLLQRLSARIRELDQNLIWNTATILPQRTLEFLQYLSKLTEKGEINITHEKLASLIGVTRPRLSEALAQLANDKKIKVESGKISLVL